MTGHNGVYGKLDLSDGCLVSAQEIGCKLASAARVGQQLNTSTQVGHRRWHLIVPPSRLALSRAHALTRAPLHAHRSRAPAKTSTLVPSRPQSRCCSRPKKATSPSRVTAAAFEAAQNGQMGTPQHAPPRHIPHSIIFRSTLFRSTLLRAGHRARGRPICLVDDYSAPFNIGPLFLSEKLKVTDNSTCLVVQSLTLGPTPLDRYIRYIGHALRQFISYASAARQVQGSVRHVPRRQAGTRHTPHASPLAPCASLAVLSTLCHTTRYPHPHAQPALPRCPLLQAALARARCRLHHDRLAQAEDNVPQHQLDRTTCLNTY